jgi:hypothetical protein
MAHEGYRYVGNHVSGRKRVQSVCREGVRLDHYCTYLSAGAWLADVFHAVLTGGSGAEVRLDACPWASTQWAHWAIGLHA